MKYYIIIIWVDCDGFKVAIEVIQIGFTKCTLLHKLKVFTDSLMQPTSRALEDCSNLHKPNATTMRTRMQLYNYERMFQPSFHYLGTPLLLFGLWSINLCNLEGIFLYIQTKCYNEQALFSWALFHSVCGIPCYLIWGFNTFLFLDK